MADRCVISKDQRASLAESYTALHEGLKPKEFLCEPWEANPVVKVLGRATEIQYRKRIPDETPSYHHPWAEQAQPMIGIDRHGQLHFAAGRYEVTRRGIEDRVVPGTDSPETYEFLRQPHVQRESWVPIPSSLTTLGKLEFVRYKYRAGNQWVERDLIFPLDKAPAIAHDLKGNLVSVPERRYQISERGVEATMHYDNPRHRRAYYGRRVHHRRRNPSSLAVSGGSSGRGSEGQRAGRMFLDTVIKGSVGVGEIVLVGYGLRKFAPTMTALPRALTKLAIGLGGMYGFAKLLPRTPHLAAGWGIGGTIDGLMDLWNSYVAPRLASIGTSTTTAPPATAPTTTPAQQALMPGGIPRQYTGYSPAACGVA